MSDYERTTITREPVDRVVVQRSGSSAGWWVAALVAVIALFGVIFVVSNSSNDSALQAARDQGAAEATLANATADAQQAASNAAQAAQNAAGGAARATESAAQAAAAKTQDAAAATADAAQDATSTEPAPRKLADGPLRAERLPPAARARLEFVLQAGRRKVRVLDPLKDLEAERVRAVRRPTGLHIGLWMAAGAQREP